MEITHLNSIVLQLYHVQIVLFSSGKKQMIFKIPSKIDHVILFIENQQQWSIRLKDRDDIIKKNYCI